MKRKVDLVDALFVFGGLFLFTAINGMIFVDQHYHYESDHLIDQAQIAKEMHDGTNQAFVISSFATTNPDIRISFISTEGVLLMDSSPTPEDEDYLSLDEIQNLGHIVDRNGDFLGGDMYVAVLDQGVYLRLANHFSVFTPDILWDSLWSGCLFASAIALLIFISKYRDKKSLEPLKGAIDNLAKVAGTTGIKRTADNDEVSTKIDDIDDVIHQKIDALTAEKEKVDLILNSIAQGIVVIGSDGKVLLVNDFAAKIFHFSKEEVLGKDFGLFIRNEEAFDKILLTSTNQQSFSVDVKFESRIYLMGINPLTSKWTVKENGKSGVAITILDVTDARNIEIMKREFFTNASHELKSPLTTIIGYQQLIGEGLVTTKEEIEDATNRTIKEAKRMKDILSEMLELARLESRETVTIEDVNLKKLVEEVCDSLRMNMEAKKLILTLQLNELTIKMNPSHANQLVRNLIDNAIKYNVDNGKIDVILDAQKNCFSVTDTGIGIAKENQSRVFERFFRVDKGRSKEQGGTGLGLAIVKHVCSQYHARIELKSELGLGTSITIAFSK